MWLPSKNGLDRFSGTFSRRSKSERGTKSGVETVSALLVNALRKRNAGSILSSAEQVALVASIERRHSKGSA